MKIYAEPRDKYEAVICLEKDCPWKRVCANHDTAGDFRSEDGVTPKLSLRNSVLHCETIHSKGDGDRHYERPVNHYDFGMTLLSLPPGRATGSRR